ncbi:MAG: aminotransferase class I/II-fold pyridoxal phosphate-dependent enzyme [Ruminococcaceae bacterium]|nr:aminotransferase class I/II-fold pyridoxal phosphate-dependent enzyme [Oscillospiraceae bacterium]
MRTPIADFLFEYRSAQMTRFHMPGHKGNAFLGPEPFDITEIKGADALYEANGIIDESEVNASKLFGSGKTLYSTEGSSQCIRAMLYLALMAGRNATIVAGRNVHKSFIYAAALLDLNIVWLLPGSKSDSLCSCHISAETLENTLAALPEPPAAVYLTSPDYLGGMLDIRTMADVCHRYGTILAVDNAHGAYLHFLPEPSHPMDLGADICCDSAHKTLPVLTGGAYLHIHKESQNLMNLDAKAAMSLFGSTSPSYLILASLDMCNDYLAGEFRNSLRSTVNVLDDLRLKLNRAGWETIDSDPLKLTIKAPFGMKGSDLADSLRANCIECEYADNDYLVLMVSVENSMNDFDKLMFALGENKLPYNDDGALAIPHGERVMSVRDAVFSKQEILNAKDSIGRICASPTVSCPPAIPIVVSGEVVTEEALKLFDIYGIENISVVI